MKTIRTVHGESTRTSDEIDFNLLRQFSARLIHAQEQERQRISQEMHDDLGNRIALMAMLTRQIIKRNSDNSSTMGRDLNKLFDQIADLAIAIREISHALHPVLLQHLGISAALNLLKEQFESTHSIRVDLTVPEELPHLSDQIELCMFRIAQEALHNVAKYSGADHATVRVAHTRNGILLRISDTGHGFVRSAINRANGLGLLSMEARALSVSGRLSVNSTPGSGTEVRLVIPLECL